MNHFSVFLVFVFVLYSSFSFCQEFDKELSADYRRKSDSLLEIGKYESAAAYLSSSFYYQPSELRTRKYRKKYRKKMSHLDSLIDCCVTDSMRCRYRVELALNYNEKGYGSRAYSWFGEAEKYCNNSEYFKSNLMKLFSPTIPDTIWVNNYEMNFNGYEIIRSNLEQNKFYQTPRSLENVSNEIVHLRRDTSLFSGVVIQKNDSHKRFGEIYSGHFEIWHFQNGKVKYHVNHIVKINPEKSKIITSDSIGKKILDYFDDDHYYYEYIEFSEIENKSREVLRIEFYPNGDTLSKRITKKVNEEEYKYTFVKFYPNGDTLSKSLPKQGHDFIRGSVTYYPEGDTNYYNAEYKTDTNTLVTKQKSWDKDNNLIFKSTEIRGLDYKTIFHKSISFNKYGDTSEYYQWEMLKGLHGIQYTYLYELDYDVELKVPYVLKVIFEMDSLQTILNRDIIFLDKRFRQISQSEFLELIEPQMHGTYWFNQYMFSLSESYEINGVTYNAVACPENYRLRSKMDKLKRKLKRME